MTEYKKKFVDTAPFIYYIEGNIGNPQYADKAKRFFKESYEKDVKLVTSVITIEEYKVFPYRNQKQVLIDSFERLLKTLDIDIIIIDKKIADKAAQIRAEYKGFKAMDALQLAAAVASGCELFLTNDKQLCQFRQVKCMTMDELD